MMRLAQRAAKKSSFMQHRVGAVLVKGNRVLSTGFNEIRYSKQLKHPTMHAEERAVLSLLQEQRFKDLAGSTIYVSRFTKGGRLGLAKPCPRCQSLLRSVGCGIAYFSTDQQTTETMKL